MNAFYNEHEPYAAQWLRNLAAAGHITNGRVDERDIQAVSAGDVDGFTRCHFFAGIAGWDYALQLAGWPTDRPVWTASLPCQPFSAAGSRKGGEDDRHLWPVFYGLVRECKPATIFGEQVEAAIGHGWLDRVFADLEVEGYACGAVSLPACSVGAPHIRQRIFWVANAGHNDRSTWQQGTQQESEPPVIKGLRRDSANGGMAFTEGMQQSGPAEFRIHSEQVREAGTDNGASTGRSRGTRRLDDSSGERGQRLSAEGEVSLVNASGRSEAGRMGHANEPRPQGRRNDAGEYASQRVTWPSSLDGQSFWFNSELIPCADGKARRVKPGIFPLAHGISARVGKLRAAGNAIVSQVAAEFVKAFMEVR